MSRGQDAADTRSCLVFCSHHTPCDEADFGQLNESNGYVTRSVTATDGLARHALHTFEVFDFLDQLPCLGGLLLGIRPAELDARFGASQLRPGSFTTSSLLFGEFDAFVEVLLSLLGILSERFQETCLLYTSPSPRDLH